MNTNTETLEQLLNKAPDYVAAVAWLADWSFNESYETGSAWLEFLDLTGISEERYGGHVNRDGYRPGYLEGDKLGDALKEWAARPGDVERYACRIMEADN